MKDAIGRRWQLGTIQVDYNLPERISIGIYGCRQPEAPSGYDPPCAVRFHGTVRCRIDRAHRRKVPVVVDSGAGMYHADQREV